MVNGNVAAPRNLGGDQRHVPPIGGSGLPTAAVQAVPSERAWRCARGNRLPAGWSQYQTHRPKRCSDVPPVAAVPLGASSELVKRAGRMPDCQNVQWRTFEGCQ